jgi:hypothetical protein
MTADLSIPALASLDFIPCINADGQLPAQFQGKVGVLGVFDQAKTLQYIGYSRDLFLTLQQLLVRQPQRCVWVKAQTIDCPHRAFLERIQSAWIAENGSTPAGNGAEQVAWSQAIAVKDLMTPEEHTAYAGAVDELTQTKLLKNVARRIEAEILQQLAARGLQMQIRFNPKLKETGLLDLK